MSVTSSSSPQTAPSRAGGVLTAERFAPGRLARATGIALAASLVTVLVIRALAVSGGATAGFTPLTIGPEVSLTALGVLGAAGVCMRLNWVSTRPVASFRRIAPLALVASLIPDVAVWVMGAYPHTGAATVLPLMAMHATVAAICLTVLPLARACH